MVIVQRLGFTTYEHVVPHQIDRFARDRCDSRRPRHPRRTCHFRVRPKVAAQSLCVDLREGNRHDSGALRRVDPPFHRKYLAEGRHMAVGGAMDCPRAPALDLQGGDVPVRHPMTSFSNSPSGTIDPHGQHLPEAAAGVQCMPPRRHQLLRPA